MGARDKTWLKLLRAPLTFGVKNFNERVIHVFEQTGQGFAVLDAKVDNMFKSPGQSMRRRQACSSRPIDTTPRLRLLQKPESFMRRYWRF